MLEVAILKNFDSGTYKAGVQLAGSLTTYFDNVNVAKNIPSAAMVVGNYVIVAIPGGNPRDAVVIATWPGGSPGANKLNDIGDVNVPSPTNGDFFYYDGATGLWKSRKLVDADIPAAIARDTEVATAVSDHAALIKGVHGALSDEDLLVASLTRSNFVMIPTSAGWDTAVTGSGGYGLQPTRCFVTTGATANSTARISASISGLNEGGLYTVVNWDKRLYVIFTLGRYASDAEAIAYLRFQSANVPGDLLVDIRDQGFGLKIENLVLKGESYGTGRAEVNLSTTLTDTHGYQIVMVLDPGTSIKWYVNGVLKGTQSTSTYIPSGISPATSTLFLTIKNGVTGGIACYLNMMLGKIWQGR